MSWADNDGNDGMVTYLEELKDELVIDEIASTWQLEIIPLSDYSIVSDMFDLLKYICNNIVTLRTLQADLEKQDMEYAEMVKTILDKSMRSINEIIGEEEDLQ